MKCVISLLHTSPSLYEAKAKIDKTTVPNKLNHHKHFPLASIIFNETFCFNGKIFSKKLLVKMKYTNLYLRLHTYITVYVLKYAIFRIKWNIFKVSFAVRGVAYTI